MTLLHKATEAGFHIGASRVFGMLRDLLTELPGQSGKPSRPPISSGRYGWRSLEDPEDYVGFILALEKMDVKTLDSLLAAAEIALGRNVLVDRVVVLSWSAWGICGGAVRYASHTSTYGKDIPRRAPLIAGDTGSSCAGDHSVESGALRALAAAVAASSEVERELPPGPTFLPGDRRRG
ncbi:MAG: hypothetical protein R3B51_13225 [Thermodesulfobacteriota bacterium]